MSGWLQNVIGGPKQAHAISTPDEYAARARAFLEARGQPPALSEATSQPTAYVNDGRWVCDCPRAFCNNSPSVSPDWGIAICLECGTVSRPMLPAFPASVERILLARPDARMRHFRPQDGETIRDLLKENAAHGRPLRVPLRGREDT